MIEYKTGDILAEETEALVNTVNCVGIMGRGIALQFKRAYPENFKAYAVPMQDATRCNRGACSSSRRARCSLRAISSTSRPSGTGEARAALRTLNPAWRRSKRKFGREASVRLPYPPLGSGLGGLDWTEVRARLEAALEEFDEVKVVIFEPGGGDDG